MVFLTVSSPVGGAPLDDLFPPKQGTCWGRVYDDAHLAKSPAQQTRALYISTVDRGKNLEISVDDLAELEDPSQPRTVSPQVYAELRSGTLLASDVTCSDDASATSCVSEIGVNRGDRPSAMRFTRVGAQLQVNLLSAAWPLRTLADQISRADQRSALSYAMGADDRVFRLDRLPAARCAEVERRYAGAFTDTRLPSVFSRLRQAASARTPEAQRLCLRSVGAPATDGGKQPALHLFLDTQRYDWPVTINEFTFRVTQSLGASRAISSLSCTSRTYAWRCQWRATDDDREQTANRAPERIAQRDEDGMLLRAAGGVLLRGFSCLAGQCLRNAPTDIALTWVSPSACEAASR